MEGVSSPPLPEEQREQQRQQQVEEGEDDDDGEGTHVLVTLEPDEEDFPTTAGDEISVVIVKESGTSPSRVADLSMGVPGDAGSQGSSFYPPFEDPDRMSRKGMVTSGSEIMCGLREDANIFTHLSHAQQCFRPHEDEVEDEQNPSMGGAILTKPHRRELWFQGMADIRSLNASSSASWDCLALTAKDGGSQGERISQRTYGCREFQVAGLPCPREIPFTLDSRIPNAVKLSADLAENDTEVLLSEAPPETYIANSRVQMACREEKYFKVEPRPHEAFHPELVEKSRQNIQRFEWVPEPIERLSPTSKEKSKSVDIGMGISMRGSIVRSEPPPITLPVLRKTLNPSLNKTATLERGLSHRKALGLEPHLNEIATLKSNADWMLQKPNIQTSASLTGVKCSWTVNADDLVEQIPSSSLEVTSCGNYDTEMRPYMCDMLLGKRDKEDLVQEEDASVYTCIECSIYFKKKDHLLEHMLQHSQVSDQAQEDVLPVTCLFSCNECGWTFRDSMSLEQHSRLHQESREKIIEEIQKLNEFSDEGREARLQCPKCVFGTNSSKVFVQHAKMHVRERKDQGVKSMSLFGSAGGKMHETPVQQMYTHFQPNELSPSPPSQLQVYSGGSKSISTCFLCGFPAPSEDILKEHMKYSHSNLSWEVEAFKEDCSQPGTSRDSYAPRPRTFSESDYFGQAERLLTPPRQKSPAHYEPKHGFSIGHQRREKSELSKKAMQTSKFQARKRAPYGSKKKLGMNPLNPAKSYSSQMGLKMKKRRLAHLRGPSGENPSKPQGTLADVWRGWSSENNHENLREGHTVYSDVDHAKAMVRSKRFVVPQSALDLKRCFRDTLRSADPSTISKRQQHQLRNMVPIVLLKALNLRRRAKTHYGKLFKRKLVAAAAAAAAAPSRDLLLDENFPMDFLFRDPQLEGSLIPDDLLDPDSLILRNEERKCPYCPDRFHNGIGLANHVRGHLNRVGVNYNVRHFISAEEVKAIEQKFSFQKKKKKGMANFDPGTFSLMRCEFCGAGFDTRAGLSSHARAHLRDFGITNWELTISPINILKELLANSPDRTLLRSPPGGGSVPSSPRHERESSSYGRKSTTPMSESSLPRSPRSPFPPAWVEESAQSYADVGAGSEDEEMVAAEMGSPGVQKNNSPAGPLDPSANRMGGKMSPEPQGNKHESQDSKSSGAEQEPTRDIRCEFCGEYFENRKGLSSHARSHLRQMGVTEWYVNGSPIDTLRDLLKRRSQPRGTPGVLGTGQVPSQGPGPKSMSKSEMRLMGALESHSSAPIRVPNIPKKLSHLGSPVAHSPSASPPTARKMFPGHSPSLQKKLKQDAMRVDFKHMMAGGLMNEAPTASKGWASHEDMSPLNLSFTDSRFSSPSASRTEPARDIRCEFCGEYFENRKGLSSHARSHLRQMGVTEWSVNGSPIDTLREIIKKKKPCPIKKEPSVADMEQQRRAAEERAIPKSPGKVLQAFPVSSLGSKTGKPSPTASNLSRELHISSSAPSKPQAPFLTPIATKRHLQDERMLHSEPKQKTYIQTELPFKFKVKSKSTQEKISASSEACCELCGLYFENRKALASHARAHLRQFGVTEWCVNGSPIETLSEWIKHRPQKAGAYRSYIQGGRPFTKKFRRVSHTSDPDANGKRVTTQQSSSLVPVGKGPEKELMQTEVNKGPDVGSAEDDPMVCPATPSETEELQRQNINTFERRPMKLPAPPAPRDDEGMDFQQKIEEVRQTPQRVRPVPSLVPRPPQTSLVKFVGNIYTLKCRFCDVEFQGPLSIQEEWVRHLQRHILDMNFSKASPRCEASRTPDALAAAQ
uniref:Protein Wiz isoform X7 n=1 Tax=Geotrypetes seraphini TaxID=260995 RepID=A0A6P8NSM7_GEOSA|nr:protein Wiz isoform X7 [Geotrypetes seraphini]